MNDPKVRRPPFDTWPAEHFDPHFGYAWYCGRGIVVAHMTITHGTEEGSNAYHDFESSVVDGHAEDVRRYGGLFVIHDWRTMASHEAAARRAWQDRMRDKPKGYLRGSIVCLAKANPVLKMAVQAVNLFSTVAYGAEVKIGTDIDAILREHSLADGLHAFRLATARDQPGSASERPRN